MIHWFIDSLIHWFIHCFIDEMIDSFINWFIEWFIDSITDLYSGGRIDCWIKYSRREDYRNPGGGKYTNTLLSIFSSLPSLLLSSPFLSSLLSLPFTPYPFPTNTHLSTPSFLPSPLTSSSSFYPFFSLTHCTPSVFSCTLPPLSSDTPTLPYLPLLSLSPMHPFLFIIYTSPDFSWSPIRPTPLFHFTLSFHSSDFVHFYWRKIMKELSQLSIFPLNIVQCTLQLMSRHGLLVL